MDRKELYARQMEGRRRAREEGVKFGRPFLVTDDAIRRVIAHKLSNKSSAELLGIGLRTWIRRRTAVEARERRPTHD